LKVFQKFQIKKFEKFEKKIKKIKIWKMKSYGPGFELMSINLFWKLLVDHGARFGGWMEIKPVMRYCLAQSKNY
jgi:hypothetical protein